MIKLRDMFRRLLNYQPEFIAIFSKGSLFNSREAVKQRYVIYDNYFYFLNTNN